MYSPCVCGGGGGGVGGGGVGFHHLESNHTEPGSDTTTFLISS